MRIAIDFRFLAGGHNVVNRGTGRYTQLQLREVLAIDDVNEYYLICHRDPDLSLLLPEIRAAKNVHIITIPFDGFRIEDRPNQADRMLRFAEQYTFWLSQYHIDVYHAAAPYQLNEHVIVDTDVGAFVATMYDLIPLVYPNQYWGPGSEYYDSLLHAFMMLSRADRLIAISESARIDAHTYLGFPLESIDLAYPFPDPMFRPLPAAEVAAIMMSLRQRLSIPQTFIMSLIHIHHSKNPEVLLEAYSRLPIHTRQSVPLVIVFHMRDVDRHLMESWMTKYGVQDHVILTGLISDDELVALYNASIMVVHPSRYEGFGYPVVEAMACGTPVITTTAASLPEVGGDAAILVDPDDIQGFTDAIQALLSDPQRRKEMSEKGLHHVRLFSPEQLGEHTLRSYELAYEHYKHRSSRPTLAVFSSFPPLQCGIADYTTELLKVLSLQYDIEIFVDDYIPSEEIMSAYVVRHCSAFERRYNKGIFHGIIYQLGQSQMQYYMYPFIMKYPGIVVIHDVNYSFGFHHLHHVNNTMSDFREFILAPEGKEAITLFHQAIGDADNYTRLIHDFYNRYPLLSWIIQKSYAQVVHMQQARQFIEDRYHNTNVYTIDMGADDPWDNFIPLRTRMIRPRVNIPLSTFVVGVFGSIDPIKRIDTIIESFANLVKSKPDSLLLIVGEILNHDYLQMLQKLAHTLGIADKVFFTGRIDQAPFQLYLLTSDVIVNLRYPSRLQMSAILARAIAAGKPILITDLPEWRYLPETFCWRIPAGDHEVRELSTYLSKIAHDPELLRQASEASRAFFLERGNLIHMAEQYRMIIEQVAQNHVNI